MTGHVVIAPDKFKGSLTAPEVTDALVTGLRRARPDLQLRLVPVADGGDGTVAAAVASGYKQVPVRATGPTGVIVDSAIAVHDETAVVELAAASGLSLLAPDEVAPMTASSFGTGELIRVALDEGARTIVLGVGGSASNDGGAGMLAALGARITGEGGAPVMTCGAGLLEVSEVDLSGLDPRLADTQIILAADVDNPLTGEFGAARVYGPQKGADTAQVKLLDTALKSWGRRVSEEVGKDFTAEPGAGAAGGVGFAALAALSAQRRPGVDVVLEFVGFDSHLAGAELVLTGEGALDDQTLRGKAPAGVAARASATGIPVIAVAGSCGITPEQMRDAGISGAYALADLEPDVERSMANVVPLLVGLGEQIALAHL